MKEVSIVLTTWNCEDLIKDCLDSLFRSTRYPFELLILDGGSQDRTRQILINYSFPKSVWFFLSPERMFKTKLENIGVKKASGDLIFLCHPDCSFTEGWLEKLVDEFIETDKFDLFLVPRNLDTARAVGFVGLMKRDFFLAIKEDENLLIEADDIDFILRAVEKFPNFEVRIAKESLIYHARDKIRFRGEEASKLVLKDREYLKERWGRNFQNPWDLVDPKFRFLR
jgi:glycosyltransferase involved in cell wall biosynthesis